MENFRYLFFPTSTFLSHGSCVLLLRKVIIICKAGSWVLHCPSFYSVRTLFSFGRKLRVLATRSCYSFILPELFLSSDRSYVSSLPEMVISFLRHNSFFPHIEAVSLLSELFIFYKDESCVPSRLEHRRIMARASSTKTDPCVVTYSF
jgi:hypothetical protein